MIPREWLEALALRVNLRRLEWRVIAIVLTSPGLVSSARVAKRLRLDYGLIKRIVRELIQWNILDRVPAGLRFQPDPTRWEPPRRIVREGNNGEEETGET